MSNRKARKISRMRGRRTHGWGSHKKHRGHGNKGGSGMGGTGKRGDAKKPSIWNDPKYFGKYGFKMKGQIVTLTTINLTQLDQMIDGFVTSGKATKNGTAYTIELEKAGYNKLLGSGQIRKKVIVTAPYASAAAIEKVSAAGGKVEGLIASSSSKQE